MDSNTRGELQSTYCWPACDLLFLISARTDEDEWASRVILRSILIFKNELLFTTQFYCGMVFDCGWFGGIKVSRRKMIDLNIILEYRVLKSLKSWADDRYRYRTSKTRFLFISSGSQIILRKHIFFFFFNDIITRIIIIYTVLVMTMWIANVKIIKRLDWG